MHGLDPQSCVVMGYESLVCEDPSLPEDLFGGVCGLSLVVQWRALGGGVSESGFQVILCGAWLASAARSLLSAPLLFSFPG